jgi:uncharacterized membrane protein
MLSGPARYITNNSKPPAIETYFQNMIIRAHVRTRFGLAAVAIAAASLGLLSLRYGDFAPSAANLPDWLPWRETWNRLAAVVLLSASAGLCYPRTRLASVFAIGAYQMIWVAIGIPSIVSSPLSIGAWYGFVEALTSLVGTWIVLATLLPMALERAVRAAQVIFGITCVFYGCSHFAYAQYTASMVPNWLPGPLGFAYFTGLAHVAAGIAIAVGVLPMLAATLEAIMMCAFGLLVWVPSFLVQPPPVWAMPAKNQWSELVVNVALVASACAVALSLRKRAPT